MPVEGWHPDQVPIVDVIPTAPGVYLSQEDLGVRLIQALRLSKLDVIRFGCLGGVVSVLLGGVLACIE